MYRKILIARKGDTFLIPGGKIHDGEKTNECITREIKEELGVEVVSQRYFGEYEDEAALDPGKTVSMEIFVVTVEGTPKECGEIEEIRCINSKDICSLKLGSVLEKYVIPQLKERNVID